MSTSLLVPLTIAFDGKAESYTVWRTRVVAQFRVRKWMRFVEPPSDAIEIARRAAEDAADTLSVAGASAAEVEPSL